MSLKIKEPHNVKAASFDKTISTLVIFVVEPIQPHTLRYKTVTFKLKQILKMEIQCFFFYSLYLIYLIVEGYEENVIWDQNVTGLLVRKR